MASRIPAMMLADKLGCQFVATAALLLYAAACIAAAFVRAPNSFGPFSPPLAAFPFSVLTSRISLPF